MARARNIKPGFFKNDELAELSPLTRLLFIGLWCIADREGRLEDRVKRIKAEVLPYDECDVDKLRNQLHTAGFVIRYTVGDQGYIQVVNFKKHQNPHMKEQASEIPAPDEHHASIVQAPIEHETSPADSPSPLTDSLNNNPKSQAKAFDDHSIEVQLAEYMVEAIRVNLPESKDPNIQKWASDIDKLIRIDKRTPDEIRNLITWAQNHSFWRSNILSPATLRKQWDRLTLQQKEDFAKGKKPNRFVNEGKSEVNYDDADLVLKHMRRAAGGQV